MRKTKIICTIGPAVDNPEMLEELMKAGMNVARINFSHGNYEDQKDRIETIKKVRAKLGKPVALLLDTKGPEIRIGKFSDPNGIELKAGDVFRFVNEDIDGDKERIYKEISVGTVILINDGTIETKVKEIDGEDIVCEVLVGGKLTNRKSMNIPGSKINLPSLTEKDIDDLTFGAKAGFDYVAASFIRKPEDVINIRKVLVDNGGENIKIISKIENREGIENFDKILEVSDGIMVARGDLGVEIPMEEVPIRQKEFIQKCIKAGKPVVTATQMLESMTSNPRPTRAEVSDVANAVYDMTTAIMLSGETASGKYPVKCVETMDKIAQAVEGTIKYWKRFKNRDHIIENEDSEYNLNYATCTTAMDLKAKAIFAYTDTGRTAKRIAGFGPQCPVYAITANEQLSRELSLVWNTSTILVEKDENIDKMIENGVKKAKEEGLIQEGDLIVIAGGASILSGARTDLNKTIGGILKV